MRKGKSYLILDNGNNPFLVFVSDKTVSVYKEPEKKEWTEPEKRNFTILVKTFNKVQKVFVGKNYSEYNGYTKNSNAGNSILLHLSGNRYVEIGPEIYEFRTPKGDHIIKYWSDVGNNDVPYPVALGEKNVYFVTGNCASYVPRKAFAPDIVWHDAYQDFYGHTKNPWYSKTYGKLWNPKHIVNSNQIDSGFSDSKLFDKFTRSVPHCKKIQVPTKRAPPKAKNARKKDTDSDSELESSESSETESEEESSEPESD